MSYTSGLLEWFTARPGEWFDGLALARIAGAYAWRTRTSEARRILEGAQLGTIENKLVRHGKRVESLYRYVPAPPVPSLRPGAARAEAARLRDRWDTLKRDVHDYAAYARGLDRAKAYMHVEAQMAALEKVTAALEADHDD